MAKFSRQVQRPPIGYRFNVSQDTFGPPASDWINFPPVTLS